MEKFYGIEYGFYGCATGRVYRECWRTLRSASFELRKNGFKASTARRTEKFYQNEELRRWAKIHTFEVMD